MTCEKRVNEKQVSTLKIISCSSLTCVKFCTNTNTLLIQRKRGYPNDRATWRNKKKSELDS